MKTLMFVFIVCFAFSGASQAQTSSSGSTSMYIVPAEPMEADEVLLVIHAFLPHSSCYLITESLEIDIFENDIVVEAHYFSGFLTMPCSTVDTIVLGQLSAGHYDLIANFDLSGFEGSDSLSFFVEMSTNITSSEWMEMELNVFPNPNNSGLFNLEFHLDEPTDIRIEVADVTGKFVRYEEIALQPAGMNRRQLDLGHLSKGLYLFTLRSDNAILTRRMIIQ